MVTNRVVIALTIALWVLGVGESRSQGMGGDMNGHVWPESTETISITGTVRVDAGGLFSMYFVDTDSDGLDDYQLDFGPSWYAPSSGISRPGNGETVSIEGRLQSGMLPPRLTVFSLNQQTWRIANEYGSTGWMMEMAWSIPGDILTVTGVVQADTSYLYHHFYLDTDDDGAPDYELGLGPMWYSPDGGAQWPADGSTVEIDGWLIGDSAVPMLVVIKLDGEAWRSESGPASWAGTWMIRNHSSDFTAYCVTDTSSSIFFPAGHMTGMMGMSWPDSAFVQFWNVHPDSLPGMPGGNTFMGFYINTENPTGGGMMGGSWGGRMGMIRYSRSHSIRLHYSDQDLLSRGLSEDNIRMRWWDSVGNVWREAVNVQRDDTANTVSLTTTDLAQYYNLSASTTVTDKDENFQTPDRFILYQNYPNPFNPSTTVAFDLPARQRVVLRVFDLLGRAVAKPVDQIFGAGNHQITIDMRTLVTGTYMYRVQAGAYSDTRLFTLLR